jgi:hypothetical protein
VAAVGLYTHAEVAEKVDKVDRRHISEEMFEVEQHSEQRPSQHVLLLLDGQD